MRQFHAPAAIVLAATAAISTPALAAAAEPEVVASFDGAAQETPEGIAIAGDGTIYVTQGYPFFTLGEPFNLPPSDGWVKAIAPDGNVSTVVHWPGGQGPAGIVADEGGVLYVARPNPMDDGSRGVYRVTLEGEAERLPGTEAILMANGLALDGSGSLYASDSALGIIWRIQLDGSADPEPWLSDPAFTGCAEGDPGVNGIALADGGMYAATTSRGALLHIPILEDGSAGDPQVVAGDPTGCELDALFGLDGIVVEDGTVIAALVLQHQLVSIDLDSGEVEVLATADDGLHNPASLAFGSGERQGLYLTNFALLPPAPESGLGAAVLAMP
jgi:sugar lactone lactonase YvrE